MATYVLVHGGGHGGWCYQRVRRLLRGGGPRGVHTDPHRSRRAVAPAEPDVDLDLHIRDVVAVLHYEDLRDVILVGHSYGGMVITGVADRAADRIGRLVYLDAATPINGQSLRRRRRARSSKRSDRWARSSTASSSCCCPRPTRACSTA